MWRMQQVLGRWRLHQGIQQSGSEGWEARSTLGRGMWKADRPSVRGVCIPYRVFNQTQNSNQCVTLLACLQIDYKGRRVTAEVIKYDSLRAMHEVMWRSLTSDRSHSAWIDFCRDVVYGEV
jgi:hypothetical protein